MNGMKNKLTKLAGVFIRDERGATAIEYALIASCISIVILVAVMALGSTLRDDLFTRVSNALG